MLAESTNLLAPAKLTLTLRVTSVRDDGMHLIEAEMVSVDLCDELTIGTGDGVSYQGIWHGDGADDDLVSRALRLVGERRRVDVTKRIPAGAGLGGGSSDAAAILRAAGHDDPVSAASLGADVAFCLRGGRAKVSGIGEVIEPLEVRPATFTLLTPPVHCATPTVYAAWDDMGGPAGDHGNDLEPAALQAYPALVRWRDELAEATGRRPRLAGSGSTWFVEGAHEGSGRRVVRACHGDGSMIDTTN